MKVRPTSIACLLRLVRVPRCDADGWVEGMCGTSVVELAAEVDEGRFLGGSGSIVSSWCSREKRSRELPRSRMGEAERSC